jgi:hypothetical protein
MIAHANFDMRLFKSVMAGSFPNRLSIP